ncbi:MAG: hypothetical protein HQ523_05520 [Lentisphaerae bacterium]|nr:hypothetical protein [Lentisphaerota bacterium]
MILLSLLAPQLVPADSTEIYHAATRGFGDVNVAARLYGEPPAQSSWITFQAEDPAHALTLASKRLADLLGFGDLALVSAPELPGTLVTLEGSGFWLLSLDGSRVQECFARDRNVLRQCIPTVGAEAWKTVPTRAYPRWLDCFDNAGPGMWVGGGGDQYVLPSDFEWLQQRKLAMCTLSPTESRLVGPGLLDTSIFDWHSAMAAKYDIPYRMLFFPASHEWLWNREPLPYVRPYPGHIAAPWLQYQKNTCAGAYEPVAVRDRYDQDLRQRLAEHMQEDPNFVGMHGCTEIPDAGIGLMAAVANTPGVKELWHGYLASTLGMDLDTVALLHKGDRRFYSSWSEVEVPLPTDFIGWNPQTCLDLRGTWQMHEDTARVGGTQAWFNVTSAPADWVEGHCNDPMILMYTPQRRKNPDEQPDFWMRRSLNVTDASLANLRFLHIARSGYHGNPTPLFDVWLNGTRLDCLSEERGDIDMCYVIGDVLKPGANQLVFNTHGVAVPGYCFMGPVPMRRYPYMTAAENRLWFDGVNFDAWLRVRKIEGQLRATRSADPDRPLKMMATINLLDMTTRLCLDYGAYQHDTGGAAGYWCPMTGARLARSHGFAWSCEQGGPPASAEALQAAMTRYIMLGNDAVDMVFGVGHYRDKPDVAAWFDKHLELIHCFGKMQLPMPTIGVLRSSRATRLGFAEPWNWDIARGPLQAVGRNFAYIEVPDILDGTIDQFPVIMDAGSVLLTEEEVEGILRYVRRGGIFVAQHHTARHTPAQADAWPLAKALGLSVTPKWMSDDNFNHWALAKMRMAEDQDLFPSLRGQVVEGSGVAIDYLGAEHSGAVGYAGSANDDRIRSVATWEEDGSMAIAEASLGRGRLIMLGTPFYTRMRDNSGVWVNQDQRSAWLDEFLTAIDVPRDSWTGNAEMWAEIWRSKNGVFDLYPVARNTAKGDETLAVPVRIRRADAIDALTEISALGHPKQPVTWKAGTFTVPASDYTCMESRVYIAPRADIARSGLDWFQVQSGIWRALPPIPAVRKPQPVDVPADLMGLTADWTLKVEGHPDRLVRPGAFGTLGLPEETVAVFEKTVTIPAGWKGSRVDLVFDAEGWFWGILPEARLLINGVEAPIRQPIRPEANPGFSFEVTAQAESGAITLRLEINGTSKNMLRKDGAGLSKPHGVTGIFYLQATSPALKTEPIPGTWQAADAFNRLHPVQPADTVQCLYLETRFTLPETWPAERLFIASPEPLGFVMVNGLILQAPAWMKRLDVSGMVYRDGRENVLRMVPAARSVAGWDRQYRGKVPLMAFEWTE